MRKIRTCVSAMLNTGKSKCTIDFGKIRGALIVPAGTKLPADLTAEKLEELCHASRSGRVNAIVGFVEYAKDGGEPQANANGYGGMKVTDVSARTDTFTMDEFDVALNASLSKCMNQPYDVYFFDDKRLLYGINDGTDTLAGFPMSTIYPTAVPHPTSSAQASLTVSFSYEDARAAFEKLDFIQLDFDVRRAAIGLTPVVLEKTVDNKYKLVEAVGGYDLTEIYGPVLAENATLVDGATAVTYDDTSKVMTLTTSAGATPRLKPAADLFEKGIKGIEQL